MLRMKNMLIYVSAEQAGEIILQAKRKESFFTEICGKEINSREKFFLDASKRFSFPITVKNSFDAYNDWMRDLSWIESDEYVIVIRDFTYFLRDDDHFKKLFCEMYLEYILPWWEGDVEKYSVGGKKKNFNVYLVP